MSSFDEEKGAAHETTRAPSESSSGEKPTVLEGTHVYNTKLVQGNGILARLCHFENELDRRLGVESQGINRVLPEQKTHQPWHQQAVMALMWASGTLQVSCFYTGIIPSLYYGLSLSQSLAITIFATLLGASTTGFCATLGPATGLRQVSISRYSFGWYPSKVIAVLNGLSQIGWATVLTITGGQCLTAVSGVSLTVGVIVNAIISLVISFIGLKAVMATDKYVWMVSLILLLVMYAKIGPSADLSAPATVSGTELSAGALTWIAIVYGSSASWASLASDYYVMYPVETSKLKVWALTTSGIALPTMFGMILGNLAGSAMVSTMPDWAEIAEDSGVGGLTMEVLGNGGWAKFTLVMFMLIGVGANCISMYSTALSIQQFSRYAAVVPRFVWSIVVFGIVIALALAGKDSLSTVLSDLLALLGYWETSFFVILFSEHVIFRKRNIGNYDLEGWNTPSKLPMGLAASAAFLIAAAGWIIGMVTTWYSGPVAKAIDPEGGDVGNELCLMLSLVYIPLRFLELKFFRR